MISRDGVAVAILAAIITPTPDIVTQSLLAFPMIGLYILSIGISAIFGRKREIPEESADESLTQTD